MFVEKSVRRAVDAGRSMLTARLLTSPSARCLSAVPPV
jgi:hypothetical protein